MIPCSQASSGPLETGRKIPDSQADPDSELPLCTMPDIPDDKCPEPELPQPRLPEPESPEPELPALSPPRLELPQPELLEEKPSSPQLPPLLPDSTPEPAVVPRRIRNSPKTGRSSVARPASERKTDLEKPTPIARTEAAKDTIVPNTQAIVQVPRSPQAPPPPFRGFTPINKPPPPSQYPQPVAPQSPGDQSECRIHPVPQPTPLSRVNAMHDLEYASMEQFEGRATPDLTGTEIIERGIALLRQQPRDDESLVDISEFFHLDRMPELEFLQDNVYPEERPAETSGRGERNNGLQQTPAPALSQPVDNSPFPQPLPLGYPSLPLTGRSFMGPPASDWVPTSYQLPVLSSQGNSFSNFATSQIPPPSTQMATQSSRMAELTNSQSITSDPASSIMPSPSPTAASPVATMTGAVSTWSFDNNYPSDSDSSQDIIPGSHGRTPESASRANTPLQAPAKVIAKSIQSRDEDMQKTIVVATRTRWAATAGTTTTRASGRVRDTRAAVGSDDKGIEEAVEILEAWKTPVIGKTKISRTRKTMGLGEPSASRQQAARTKSVTRSPVAKMRASTSSLIPVFPNEELEESEVKETGNSEGEEVVMATEPSTTGSLRATRSRSTVPKPAPSQPEKTPRRTTKSPSKASTATSSQAAKTQARASKATSSQTAKTPTQIPATTRITRSRNPTVTEPKITVFGETNDDNEVDGLTK
ncbi:hypothetical protein FPQ18DRAFT_351681 [Pyronema domesticum]|nr:hypothetical protein FPQ18DRAFT_351681 [Pyronema domesticum]